MIPTPDLYDEHRGRVQVANNNLRHFGAKSIFMGQAVTVYCPNDNSLAVELLKTDGAGKILVIDGGATQQVAFLGDQMAEQALNNHWEGVIVNGCVRDVEILETMDLGVMAIGVTPRSTIKKGEGSANIPVTCQGLQVKPGDYLYADRNGLLLSPTPLI